MNKEITPIPHPVDARIRVPGSKSLTNRALLIAAMAEGNTRLSNALFSDDTIFLLRALQTLGFDIALNPGENSMEITGMGGSIPANTADLQVGNAGTAARFLTAFLTLGNGTFTIDGNARMRERPIGDLVSALNQLGALVQPLSNEQKHLCPPVRINASGLSGGKTTIPGDISSQFLSALLMVAPYAAHQVEIEVSGRLNSRPYIDMTLAVMSDFGVKISRSGYKRFVIHPARYTPIPEYPIEPDASSASYFFAVPAVCGGTICVEHIHRSSNQGDIGFVDVLARMGCPVEEDEKSISISGPARFTGLDVDMRDIPDTAQTLAAIAPFADSPTRIRGIATARLKETDRVSAACKELRKLGVKVKEYDDGMTIYPTSRFHAANIQTYADHRMAMAFSLIGLRVPGIVIENPGCVSKTFPTFFDVLDTL